MFYRKFNLKQKSDITLHLIKFFNSKQIKQKVIVVINTKFSCDCS